MYREKNETGSNNNIERQQLKRAYIRFTSI